MRRLLSAIAAAFVLALPFAARAVDIEGYWYVLVHFQDAATNHPEAWRWEDRVWHFEKSGDRLEWTEWPIVALEDETGRFENLSGSRAARVVAAWQPNALQLADIKDGLAVNSRGQAKNSLRSSAGGTIWKSNGGEGANSATEAAGTKGWSIEGLPSAPVFSRVDPLSRTVFTTESVNAAGDEIAGTFERDSTRKGRFRMIRSGEPGHAGTDSLEERQRQGMKQRAVESGWVTEEEAAIMDGQVPRPSSANRAQTRAAIREALVNAAKAQGQDPDSVALQIESVARQVEHALFDLGKSPEEVNGMISRGEIRP